MRSKRCFMSDVNIYALICGYSVRYSI